MNSQIITGNYTPQIIEGFVDDGIISGRVTDPLILSPVDVEVIYCSNVQPVITATIED